jgi:hypothetical protein
MQPDTLADQILDRIHIAVRKKLPEIRGRTIAELTVLFGDLRVEIADMLAEANCVTGG